MSYEEPLYSNRNGLMLMDGLPADLIPGAALALAFRAGNSSEAEVGAECLERIIEFWPEGESEIRLEFTRGMEDVIRRELEGRYIKRLELWERQQAEALAEEILPTLEFQTRVLAVRNQIMTEAIQFKAEGGRFQDFARHHYLRHKEVRHFPGITAEVLAIWEGCSDA